MRSGIRVLIVVLAMISVSVEAQTQKKPVKKATTTTKQAQQKKAAERAAAIAKAKEDSVAAVHALAVKLAREMFVKDSLSRVEAEEQARLEQIRIEEQEAARLAEKERLAKSEKGSSDKKSGKRPGNNDAENLQKEEKKREAAERKRLVAEARAAQREEARAEKQQNKAVAARRSGGRGIGLGVKGYGGYSAYFGDGAGYVDNHAAFGGGLTVNLSLGKKFAVVPEFLFNHYQAGTGINTVQVPLLFRLSTGSYNKGFFVNLGPYGEYYLDSGNYGASSSTIGYGAALGMGAGIPIGKSRLTLELRGNYYLGNNNTGFNDSGLHNITPTFNLGYMFFFK